MKDWLKSWLCTLGFHDFRFMIEWGTHGNWINPYFDPSFDKVWGFDKKCTKCGKKRYYTGV